MVLRMFGDNLSVKSDESRDKLDQDPATSSSEKESSSLAQFNLPLPVTIQDGELVQSQSGNEAHSFTSLEMEQLMQDFQTPGDIKSEESDLLTLSSDQGEMALLSPLQDFSVKGLVAERPNYLINEDEKEDEESANSQGVTWLDLTCLNEETTASDSEDEDGQTVSTSSHASNSPRQHYPVEFDNGRVSLSPRPEMSMSPRNLEKRSKQSRKSYPQVPTRSSKRLKNLRMGEENWLEDRAVTHFVLSPYDGSLDLLSCVL